MSQAKYLPIAVALAILVGPLPSQAEISQFDWVGGTDNQDWQVDGNWTPAGFPNDPQHLANFSVGLAGNLNVSLGSDVTVAGMNLGDAATALTIEISGATLRLQNDFERDLANADFNNNSLVDGGDLLNWQRGFGMSGQDVGNGAGDADEDQDVDADDLAIWQQSYGLDGRGISGGQPIIKTAGLSGAVNRINSNVHLVNENVEVIGFSDLTIAGNISFEDPTPVENEIGASVSNTSAGITTTVDGAINISNQADGMRGDFGLNTSPNAQGNLIVNGVISDGAAVDSDLFIGPATNNIRMPLHTVRLNAANTYSGGTRIRRVNLELAHDEALGSGPVRQAGPANQFGYNIIAVGGDRTLANDFVVAQWQTFKGSNSIILAGDVTQTNNRGFVNQLDEGATLTLTGLLEIWEDDEVIEREFEFDGTGTTIFTGMIRDDPQGSQEDRQITKSGTGVLTIDVASGDNLHTGPTNVVMGNLHYADNDSLNTGFGLIRAVGGAVGVDTGVAGNSAFMNKIDPDSTGGLMLAPSDAAATLDFTTTLSRAAGMTVAPPEGTTPETPYVFAGAIIPANATYGLGGGTGTIRLADAQLTGSNSVEIRNGGTVQLFGENTYTGTTLIATRYAASHQEQAEADSSNANDADSIFFDRLVAPVLEVDQLADGGQSSSIGAASSSAANLFLQGSTLKYVGDGDTTDRLFTIGTGGATIDASGTGPVVFDNPGLLGRDDAEPRIGTLDDASRNPNEVYDLGNTNDLIAGMSINDPDPGGPLAFTCPMPGGDGSNCIPTDDPDDPGDPVVVTGVSDDGAIIGISAEVPTGIFKVNTRIVFGTVPRTLTLAGSNAEDNTLASIIADSAGFPAEPDVPVPPGVVNLEKAGVGTWVLTGNNTYSGDTTVEEGILRITNPFLHDDSAIQLNGGTFDLDFVGEDVIGDLFIDGVAQADGRWGALGNAGADFTSPFISGVGLLNVGGLAIGGAAAAVPEPASLLLLVIAAARLGLARRSSTPRHSRATAL